jgi:uncharacterized protein (TIGR03000 family)
LLVAIPALLADVASAQVNVLRVTVIVQADAELFINGAKTSQTGMERHFVSPALDRGQKYTYEFRARWKVGGKDEERTHTLNFKPGDEVTLDFTVAPEKSLYERLGGEKALKAVIDDFVARAAADPKVNFARKGTAREWKATPENVAKLKAGLTRMLGAATGGPQKYTGRSMKDVHKGMAISDREFAALADDLKASLDKLKVPPKLQDELLALVAATGADIVEPGAPKPTK